MEGQLAYWPVRPLIGGWGTAPCIGPVSPLPLTRAANEYLLLACARQFYRSRRKRGTRICCLQTAPSMGTAITLEGHGGGGIPGRGVHANSRECECLVPST